MIEGTIHFDNGQGALQPFSNPEWNVYHFTPYCGTSCVPYIYGCLDVDAQNYNKKQTRMTKAVTTQRGVHKLDTWSTHTRLRGRL